MELTQITAHANATNVRKVTANVSIRAEPVTLTNANVLTAKILICVRSLSRSEISCSCSRKIWVRGAHARRMDARRSIVSADSGESDVVRSVGAIIVVIRSVHKIEYSTIYLTAHLRFILLICRVFLIFLFFLINQYFLFILRSVNFIWCNLL